MGTKNNATAEGIHALSVLPQLGNAISTPKVPNPIAIAAGLVLTPMSTGTGEPVPYSSEDVTVYKLTPNERAMDNEYIADDYNAEVLPVPEIPKFIYLPTSSDGFSQEYEYNDIIGDYVPNNKLIDRGGIEYKNLGEYTADTGQAFIRRISDNSVSFTKEIMGPDGTTNWRILPETNGAVQIKAQNVSTGVIATLNGTYISAHTEKLLSIEYVNHHRDKVNLDTLPALVSEPEFSKPQVLPFPIPEKEKPKILDFPIDQGNQGSVYKTPTNEALDVGKLGGFDLMSEDAYSHILDASFKDVSKEAEENRTTSGNTKIKVKTGGVEQMWKDFNEIEYEGPIQEREGGLVKIGDTAEGERVVGRVRSKDGRPTLELQKKKTDGKTMRTIEEIRYE